MTLCRNCVTSCMCVCVPVFHWFYTIFINKIGSTRGCKTSRVILHPLVDRGRTGNLIKTCSSPSGENQTLGRSLLRYLAGPESCTCCLDPAICPWLLPCCEESVVPCFGKPLKALLLVLMFLSWIENCVCSQ